jgi:hypothetical protein
MFYGFCESESFDDPSILNNYHQVKVVIEKRADGKGFWHIVILKVDDSNIKTVIETISYALKSDWNAMFYNETTLYAIFKDKVFSLPMKKIWHTDDYINVKQYAKECNVGNLDMNEVFSHYHQLLLNT